MKSLHKVINIIDAVAHQGRVGLRSLSSITGYPPTTIHRIASTLVQRGYFRQDPITKTYSLSFKFLELGTSAQRHLNLLDVARSHLEKLMQDTRENVNIAVQDGDEVVYLDQIQSGYSMLQLFTEPGSRVPLYATGVGKMFMSHWSEDELNAFLEQSPREAFTKHTKVGPNEIVEELARIRVRGYAVDNEEMEQGVRCVAALILGHEQQAVAAVSISGAALRISSEKLEFFGERVKQCALRISRELGGDVAPISPPANHSVRR